MTISVLAPIWRSNISRVLSLLRALPFSVSATAFTLVPDSFPTTRQNTVQGRSPSSPGPKSVVPDGSHVGDSVAPAGLKCERGDQGRQSSPRLESPKRLQQAAATGNPELFWKGGAQTPRQGLLSAFPGLASLAHAALCPSSPLHQRAMQHYPRLVHHLPQRSGRTGIKKKLADHGTVQHAAPSIAMLHRRCLSMHREMGGGGSGLCGGVGQPESPSIHSAAKQQSAL